MPRSAVAALVVSSVLTLAVAILAIGIILGLKLGEQPDRFDCGRGSLSERDLVRC